MSEQEALLDALAVVFAPRLRGDTLLLGNGATVSLAQFAILFDVEAPTYDALVACDPEDVRGYRRFFDECKAQGILS